MEFTVAYFWVVKLLLLIVLLLSIYIYHYKLTSKLPKRILGTFIILQLLAMLVNPIKISVPAIEQPSSSLTAKPLPKAVVDSSFTNATSAVQHISAEDLK